MYGLGTHSLDQTLLLFGKPKSVTAFLRVLREGGADDAIDDSFTIVLQYGGEHKQMIATVKTTVVSSQPKQLKYWVRGTNGTFFKVWVVPAYPNLILVIKFSTDRNAGRRGRTNGPPDGRSHGSRCRGLRCRARTVPWYSALEEAAR